jgi:BON domain
MENSTSPSVAPPTWDKKPAFNEKLVGLFGILAFFLVLVLSVAARLILEVAGSPSDIRPRPEALAARSLARGDVLVPVTLSIKFANGKAIVRGTVPDEKSHELVINRAKQIYGGIQIVDHLGIQPGIVLTPWFDSVLKWFPPKIEQIRAGEISVNGMNVLLFGQVQDISARIAAGSAAAKLAGPEGHVMNDLQVAFVEGEVAPTETIARGAITPVSQTNVSVGKPKK